LPAIPVFDRLLYLSTTRRIPEAVRLISNVLLGGGLPKVYGFEIGPIISASRKVCASLLDGANFWNSVVT